VGVFSPLQQQDKRRGRDAMTAAKRTVDVHSQDSMDVIQTSRTDAKGVRPCTQLQPASMLVPQKGDTV
jgi:hypothetical protein